jgi:hypothetical protein
MRRLLIAVLAATACFAAAAPSVVHAATPCWERVIEDWTKDGQIKGHYSPKCLRQAYNNVPEDLADYSSIKDDINAALLGPTSPNSGPGSGGNSTSGTNGNGTSQPPSAKEAQKRADQTVPHAGTPASIPDSSRTLPLPLLILAAVAAAALLAAASPPLIHRVRARFPRGRPTPQPDR